MKNIVKMIGLFILIGFSFFYTDKVVEVIREEDEIMIELKSVEELYKVPPVDASILRNTIIPGTEGRDINIDLSYKQMKRSGLFNKNLIVYDNIPPKVSIHNNKDKFIIKANSHKQMISLVFIVDNNKYFDNIEEVLQTKETIANYFVSYSYLINNSTKIKEIKNQEFYSYGENGTYSPDNLLFSNNLLSRIKDNEANYCLTPTMDENTLKLCSDNNLYTIVPTLITTSNPYATIKEKLTSGSIILLPMNQETLIELPIIIDYVKGKGYKITGLKTLLSEELS